MRKMLKPIVDSTMVTQLMMLMAENFVDILVENDDVDELVVEDEVFHGGCNVDISSLNPLQ